MSYKEIVAKHEKAVAASKDSKDFESKPSSLFVLMGGSEASKSSPSQYVLDQQGFSVLQVSSRIWFITSLFRIHNFRFTY